MKVYHFFLIGFCLFPSFDSMGQYVIPSQPSNPVLLATEPSRVEKAEWGQLANGDTAWLFSLQKGKISAQISTYGAQIVSLKVPDKNDQPVNVVWGHPDLATAEKGAALASVIGRYANRIDTGGFDIDGQRYDLESVNKKTNIQIHGGKTGFHRQNWGIEDDPEKAGFTNHPVSVTLRLFSPDGHEGFPGNVTVWVQYRLGISKRNPYRQGYQLEMEFRATTDKPTHINLTNHAYFNLAGKGTTLDGHFLYCGDWQVLEFDERKIPTGKRLPLSTLKLQQSRNLLKPHEEHFTPLDHCFAIAQNNAPLNFAGALYTRATAIKLDVRTTQPGVQIYTANHFKNNPYPKYGAICFETQHYPDTPNRPEFPTTLLRPGETLKETTVYEFTVAKSDPRASRSRSAPGRSGIDAGRNRTNHPK